MKLKIGKQNKSLILDAMNLNLWIEPFKIRIKKTPNKPLNQNL